MHLIIGTEYTEHRPEYVTWNFMANKIENSLSKNQKGKTDILKGSFQFCNNSTSQSHMKTKSRSPKQQQNQRTLPCSWSKTFHVPCSLLSSTFRIDKNQKWNWIRWRYDLTRRQKQINMKQDSQTNDVCQNFFYFI